MLDSIAIGNRIKEKQEEHHYKQKEIVEKTGISKSAISNYISGNRVPDTETILKLSYVLNTSIEWLLTGKSTNENYTAEEKSVIEAYRKADSAEQGVIKKILDIQETEEKLSHSKIG